jgi:hypothetical protein
LEEIITVLENWIKDAKYGEGEVQHVINLGLHNKFVEVPLGDTFSFTLRSCIV